MPFEPGKSGNPGGRSKVRLPDGRTLTDLARELTIEAVETLAEVMRDKQAPSASRVAASTQILNRGWGQAPQTINVTEVSEAPDLSQMSNEQLEALETLRSLTSLTDSAAGSC